MGRMLTNNAWLMLTLSLSGLKLLLNTKTTLGCYLRYVDNFLVTVLLGGLWVGVVVLVLIMFVLVV